MFTVELKDDVRKIEIETDVQIAVFHDRVQAFVKAVEALHKAVPLASFVGQREPMRPLVYSYQFVTADGRSFTQRISFTNGVRMTFAVGTDPDVDGWETREFVPHRALRDEFIALVRDFGLEKAEVEYGTP